MKDFDIDYKIFIPTIMQLNAMCSWSCDSPCSRKPGFFVYQLATTGLMNKLALHQTCPFTDFRLFDSAAFPPSSCRVFPPSRSIGDMHTCCRTGRSTGEWCTCCITHDSTRYRHTTRGSAGDKYTSCSTGQDFVQGIIQIIASFGCIDVC